MRKIAAIHTTKATIGLVESLHSNDDVKIIHILDETILPRLEVDKNDEQVKKNILNMLLSAKSFNCDSILIACSTIGNYTKYSEQLELPIYRIDKNLIDNCNKEDKILVLGTIETTKEPTMELFQEFKNAKFKIVDNALSEARKGNKETHDKLIINEINKSLNSYDQVVLAQASMHDAGVLSGNEKVTTSVLAYKRV